VPTPSGVWLVDGVQPVAAFLPAITSTTAVHRPRLMDWAATPPPPPLSDSRRVVLAEGDGFAVQDGDGTPIVRVASDGGVSVHPAPGLALQVAHDGDLWLTGGDQVTVLFRPHDESAPPPGPLGEGVIVVVGSDGSRREVTVDHPVTAVAADPRGLVITVSEQPVNVAAGGHVRHEYPTATVRLDWDDRSPRLRIADLAAVPPPRWTRSWWYWHDHRPESVRASAVAGLGLLWSAGRVRTGSRPGRDHPVLVTGQDPVTLAERVRVDLGVGGVLDVAVVDSEVWLAVDRGRWVDPEHPVEVVAVTAAGRTRMVLAGDTVDITDRCRALIAQDEDTRTGHPTRERDQHGDLQAYWHQSDGTTTPLADGVTDATVTVHGGWPDTVLQFTCHHPSRPGLLLRRRVGLFDELGRPVDTPLAAILLRETLDTGLAPPAGDAHNGILDV